MTCSLPSAGNRNDKEFVILGNRLLLILLSPLLIVALSGFRNAPLVNPDPIAIPAGTSQGEVARVIKTALISRSWILSEDQAGSIIATQNVRDDMARISVDYDASHVRVKYVTVVILTMERSVAIW